jgi:hypothetical protein
MRNRLLGNEAKSIQNRISGTTEENCSHLRHHYPGIVPVLGPERKAKRLALVTTETPKTVNP